MADSFWDNVDRCARGLRSATSVDGAIAILNDHFITESADSAADAFFGGSGGDDQVMDMLSDAGWTIVWSEAVYFFVARDPHGDLLTYIEGDVYRGDRR
jgi:hypothetical protein